jgi:hypothetical protein
MLTFTFQVKHLSPLHCSLLTHSLSLLTFFVLGSKTFQSQRSGGALNSQEEALRKLMASLGIVEKEVRKNSKYHFIALGCWWTETTSPRQSYETVNSIIKLLGRGVFAFFC